MIEVSRLTNINPEGRIIATGTSDELEAAAGQPGSPLEEIVLQLTESPA
jgi:hypothetical protein